MVDNLRRPVKRRSVSSKALAQERQRRYSWPPMSTSSLCLASSLLLAAALLTTAPRAWGQQDDVNPDRPGAGTSALTVPRGALQLETGVDHASERRAGEPTQRRTSLATTVRYGLLDGVELRLDGEPFVALRGGEHATNIGDVFLGAKLRLLEGGEGLLRPTLSLLPVVKLPTAPAPIGTERADFQLLGLATFTAGRVGFDLNAGLAALGQRDPSGYLVQAFVAGTLGVDVTDAVNVFAEIFYNSPAERDGDDLVGASAGVSYKLTRNLALDAAVITTLAGRGPDYRVQAGMTIRLWP